MRIRSVALRTNNITGNIKLRMKTILRNLLSVLRRFKMATLLNVLGLSVAFSAFILIMMQVEYDQNFDRGYTDTESIFRVEAMFEDGGQAVIGRCFYPILASYRSWDLGESLGRGLVFLCRREWCTEYF